jgi:arylamine N-acetyltransferase
MDVSPKAVYDRFINHAKGSYCFGQNTLLLGVLRALGFRAYSGAARVNLWHNDPEKEPYYRSLTHMLLFVQPNPGNEETWVVDVGFGALNLVRPVPLLDSAESGERGEVQGAFTGEVHRLTRGTHPNCSVGVCLCSLDSRLHISSLFAQTLLPQTAKPPISRRTTSGTWKFAILGVRVETRCHGRGCTASPKKSFS